MKSKGNSKRPLNSKLGEMPNTVSAQKRTVLSLWSWKRPRCFRSEIIPKQRKVKEGSEFKFRRDAEHDISPEENGPPQVEFSEFDKPPLSSGLFQKQGKLKKDVKFKRTRDAEQGISSEEKDSPLVDSLKGEKLSSLSSDVIGKQRKLKKGVVFKHSRSEQGTSTKEQDLPQIEPFLLENPSKALKLKQRLDGTRNSEAAESLDHSTIVKYKSSKILKVGKHGQASKGSSRTNVVKRSKQGEFTKGQKGEELSSKLSQATKGLDNLHGAESQPLVRITEAALEEKQLVTFSCDVVDEPKAIAQPEIVGSIEQQVQKKKKSKLLTLFEGKGKVKGAESQAGKNFVEEDRQIGNRAIFKDGT